MRTQHTTSSGGSTLKGGTIPTRHVSVLLQAVLEVLDIQEHHTVLDGTLGGGGHAAAFAQRLSADGHLIGTDVDSEAVARARARLARVAPRVTLMHGNFRNLTALLSAYGIEEKLDRAFFDLGWSSDQLESAGRGLSFMRDEPLSMRLSDTDDPDALTAAEIVNTWQEESIADILYGWGGERFARRIARAIVARRATQAFATTLELRDTVVDAVPARFRHGKRHPATKTFQALRIAVNDELGALKDVLEALPAVCASGARVAFLSFHSLEDTLVKHTLRAWERDALGTVLTKKPLTPAQEELGQNSRARSAKLRAFAFTHYAEKKHTH